MKPAGFVRLAKTKISFVEPIFRWLFVVTDIRSFDETEIRSFDETEIRSFDETKVSPLVG
jgi:hypothetical protein